MGPQRGTGMQGPYVSVTIEVTTWYPKYMAAGAWRQLKYIALSCKRSPEMGMAPQGQQDSSTACRMGIFFIFLHCHWVHGRAHLNYRATMEIRPPAWHARYLRGKKERTKIFPNQLPWSTIQSAPKTLPLTDLWLYLLQALPVCKGRGGLSRCHKADPAPQGREEEQQKGLE